MLLSISMLSPDVDITPPTIPVVSATNIADTSFTLSWTASTDSNSGVKGYWHKQIPHPATFTTALSANYTGLINGDTRSYSVASEDNDGNISEYSLGLSVTLLDTQAPTVPTNLASAQINTTNFILSWTASTDNVGVLSYDILKDGVYYTNSTSTSKTITGLISGTTSVWTVKAVDESANKSAASTGLSVTQA